MHLGRQDVLKVELVGAEALTLITQLFVHASILKVRHPALGKRCYEEWVETMRRSDRLLDAILALGGRPSSRVATTLSFSEDPIGIFEADITLAEHWVTHLENTAAAISGSATSTLSELIDAERASLDWRRQQRDNLRF